MRVALDLTIPARTVTGVGVYARGLAAALAQRPLELRRWQLPLRPAGPGWPRLSNALRLVAWFERGVRRRVRREEVTVYHVTSSLGPRRVPCPWVMTIHDATFVTMRAQFGLAQRVFNRAYGLAAARQATALIVSSDAARARIARGYGIPAGRLTVVPHGVAPDFRPAPRPAVDAVLAPLGLPRPYALFVGAEPRRKNLHRLVEALGVLHARRLPLHLVLAGPPAPRDETLTALAARRGLAGAVRRCGEVPAELLPALYGGAACLAYPSLEEGFGLPVLEAMACGTPVLTSRDSAMAEVAGEAALLVDPLDVGALAAGLEALVTDRGLAGDLAERGLARARAFTWERSAAATEAVYRRAAGLSR